MAGEATPDEIPPVPAAASGAGPAGISGFTGQLGAGGSALPALPAIPPPAVLGIGPQPVALPLGTPATALGSAAGLAQQIHTLDEQKAVTGAEAENQAAGQFGLAGIDAAAADKLAAQQEAQKAAWEHAQKQVDERTEALRTSVADAAAKQVDPNRLWASKSTGSKILAGLGVALGAAGASLGHGQNTAMSIFQGAIDSDIAAQKDNIANSWKGVQEKHGLDNDDATRAMHDQKWRSDYQIAGLENVKLQASAMAAKTSSVSVKNNAELLKQKATDQQTALRLAEGARQAAATAGAGAKAEKLAGEARAMFSKLVEKEGTDPAAAQKVVDSQFPQLKGTAYASAGQQAEQRNDLTAQTIARQTVAASNGAITLDQALKAARAHVEAANPAYGSAGGGGPLNVPKEAREAEQANASRMAQLDSFDPKVIHPSISEGLPGPERYKVIQQQESYAKFAREQAIANFRANTGETIKSPEQIDALVKQYLPAGAYESVERTKMRMDALRHDSEAAARTKGATVAPRGAPAAGAAPFVPSAPARSGAADPFVPAGGAIPAPVAPPVAPRERAPGFRQ